MNVILKNEYLFGDRAFYRRMSAIVVPIIIQSAVTNFVSLLDNIMVGQVGTLQMSAVAIVNQLLMIFNLCVFACVGAAGIFSAQYVGAKSYEGVRNCFRIKIIMNFVCLLIALAVFTIMPGKLISSYLTEGGDTGSEIMHYAQGYLKIMLTGLLPFCISQAYSGTLRENGDTTLPMAGSVAAILVNLVFNYLLIFGKLGFPELGVQGAAVATVFSRYVELAIIAICVHKSREKYRYFNGVYRTFKCPGSLWKGIMVKGMPLVINEFFWSSALAAVLQCYSMRGINAVAASNIASTVSNLFYVVFFSMGSALSVMVGQELGAGDNERAVKTAWRILVASALSSIVMGMLMLMASGLIPKIYNTEKEVRELAANMLRVLSLMMPIFSINHASYFTLRSGGRTVVTFLFDSVFTWVFNFGCAFLLTHFTSFGIIVIYAFVQMTDVIKSFIGIALMRSRVWVRNIVS